MSNTNFLSYNICLHCVYYHGTLTVLYNSEALLHILLLQCCITMKYWYRARVPQTSLDLPDALCLDS